MRRTRRNLVAQHHKTIKYREGNRSASEAGLKRILL
jgi:hypothetical protein